MGLSAIGVVWLTAALRVQPVPQDAPCPTREAVAASVERWLGTPTGGAYVVVYEVRPAQNGHRLAVSLEDGHGAVRLRRTLDVAAGGCAGAAEALAVIVERYFRGVGWTAGTPLPTTEPPKVVAVALAAPARITSDVATAAPRPASAIGVFAAAGSALDIAGTARGAIGVEIGWALRERLVLAVDGMWRLTPAEQPIGSGSATARSATTRLAIQGRRAWGRASVRLGPALSWRRDAAETKGLSTTGRSQRHTIAAGGRLGVGVAVLGGAGIALDVGLFRTLGGGRFVVAGVGEVLPPAALAASVGVHVFFSSFD